MIIRKATWNDFPEMQRLYAHAREQMKKNGNPTQWGDNRPPINTVKRDLAFGRSYVTEENGHICGTFAFAEGPDDTYGEIMGAWLNEEPYVTVHRLASDNTAPGVFSAAIAFAAGAGRDIRMDTHENNAIMRHLFEKYGFQYCGIIITDDGTPRRAYQKLHE